MNLIKDRPRFYNTLTTNCTTMILAHTTMNPGHLPMSWKVLLSGARAQAADKSPDFSRLIRVGMP